jgi:hypothetical protein
MDARGERDVRELKFALCRILGQVDAGEVAAPVSHAAGDAITSLVRREQYIGFEVHLGAAHAQEEPVRVNPLAARALGSRGGSQHTPCKSDYSRCADTYGRC